MLDSICYQRYLCNHSSDNQSLGEDKMTNQNQMMEEMAEAIRNLLAYGSRFNPAAKATLARYQAQLTPQTLDAEQAVKLIDPTAKFYVWSDGPCGWVKGAEWETMITRDEQHAWELAMEQVASHSA